MEDAKGLRPAFQGAVYLAALVSLFRPVTDADVWWHLATGRAIVNNRAVPHVDIFSQTAAGTPWINTYWLFDVVLYLTHFFSGLAGVIALHALLVVALLVMAQKRLRENGLGAVASLAAVAVIFLGTGRGGDLWGKYASVVSVFFLAVLLWWMDRARRVGWGREMWVWPFVFCLWANMHRGVTFGLVIAACYALGGERLKPRELARRLGWLALCALATLVNPFGPEIYRMMSDDMSLSGRFIVGWDTPVWLGLEVFWISVAALWLSLAWDAWTTRRARWDVWSAALFLTVIATRHKFGVPFFMLFAVPLLAQFIFARAHTLRWRLPHLLRQGALAVGTCVALVTAHRLPAGGGFDGSLIPAGGVEMIADFGLPGPFYNDYFFGGYFLWRLGGQPPVFIDGRYPAVAGYQPLLEEILKAKFSTPAAWAAFLEKHRFQGALVKYLPDSPYSSLYEVYFPVDRWALVYWDDAGLLYLRRGVPANAEAIALRDFHEVLPDATPAYFRQRYNAAPAARQKRLRQELHMNVFIHPESRRTRSLLSLVSKGLDTPEIAP